MVTASESPKAIRKVPDQVGASSNGALSCYRRLNRRFKSFRLAYISHQERHPRLYLGIEILYAALVASIFIATRTPPTIPFALIFLLILVGLTGRAWTFLRDWSPFLVVLAVYETLSTFSNQLLARANFGFALGIDHALFRGQLPTTLLQEALWNPNTIHWYDYASTILYAVHFIVPVVLAYVFWQWNRSYYWRFIVSYMLLSFTSYLTFIAFPAAPPWLAAQRGLIPHVSHVSLAVIAHIVPLSTPAASGLSVDLTAAMPSLHAAFPLLVWLVVWRIWPKWGWAMIVYPLAVSFAVIYMGEHYVADVIAGWVYGGTAYALVWCTWPGPLQERIRHFLTSISRRGPGRMAATNSEITR